MVDVIVFYVVDVVSFFVWFMIVFLFLGCVLVW